MLPKTKRTAVMHRGKRIRAVQEYWYCTETGQHVQDPEQEYAHRTRLDAAYARMVDSEGK